MAGNENDMYKHYLLYGQTDEEKAQLLYGSKFNPNYTIMQDLPKQYQGVKYLKTPDDIQQQNEEIKQTKQHRITDKNKKANNYEAVQNIDETKQNYENREIEENIYSVIASNSYEMRLRVLNMEIDVIISFSSKTVFENEQNIREKIYTIETCIDKVHIALNENNFDKVETELFIAENISTELMKKIKKVVNRKVEKQKKVQTPDDNVEIPDYRSIVTIRGTKEDVKNCIIKAKIAMEKSNFVRAKSLLLKAERILSTKNARDLLEQVEVAEKLKQNDELNEKATAAEAVGSVKNEDLQSKPDNMSAYEKGPTAGKKMRYAIDDSSRVEQNLTPRAKELLNKNSDIHFLCEKNTDDSDCHNFSSVTNESNRIEASKCINVAQTAFQEGKYDRAERFLVKSLRIYHSQYAISFLETVRNTKAQKNTNVTMTTGEKVDSNGGKLRKGEHFQGKTQIRINSNEQATKIPKNNQDYRASKTSSAVAITKKSIKNDDLKREKEAVLEKLLDNAKDRKKFGLALYYIEQVLKNQPNENTKKRMKTLKEKIPHRSASKEDLKLEALKLLDAADTCIKKDIMEKAELYLIISWNMFKTLRTIKIYEEFLKTRKAKYLRFKKNPNEGNVGYSEAIYNSDSLVLKALEKYGNRNRSQQIEKDLLQASQLHPSFQIDQLLAEMRTRPEVRKTNRFCTIL